VESSRRSLSPAPIHLHPTAPLAERVLLPGDPARALLLAQTLLEEPKMFNHHRGLWGYTGVAPDGQTLTIQSTGMGGPSAAIVVSELADLGATRLVRVGTCGGLSSRLALGDLLVVDAALPFDGTSRALWPAAAQARSDGGLAPDRGLFDALRVAGEEDGSASAAKEGGSTSVPDARSGAPDAGADARSGANKAGADARSGATQAGAVASATATHAGPVASTDLFYDTPPEEQEQWLAAGALAVEMEAATLFAVARRRSLQAAALLLVSDLVFPERVRISEEALRDGERRLGQVALSALLD